MRRKPENKKKLTGTSRPDRVKSKTVDTSNVSNEIPPSPLPLIKTEEQDYKDLISYLQKNGVFRDVDAIHVAVMCINLTTLRKLVSIKRNPDKMVEFYQSGASNVTGKATVWSKTLSEINDCSKLLGLSPYHRDKIVAFSTEPKKETNPLEDFMTNDTSLKKVV